MFRLFWAYKMSIIKYLGKKAAPYILAAGLAAGLFSGCKKILIEYSVPLNTPGTVAEKKHIKESYMNPADNINPMRDIDPLFDMRHGRFITKQNEEFNVYVDTLVGRFRANNRALFDSVEANSSVEVSYCERFRSIYYDADKDGKEDLVERTFEGYELLNIQPKK